MEWLSELDKTDWEPGRYVCVRVELVFFSDHKAWLAVNLTFVHCREKLES